MDCHDKYLNTHKSPPTPLQSSLSENATSRTFNKYNLKALNNWKSTICLLLHWHENIALFDVDRQKYSMVLSFYCGMRLDAETILLCSLWPAHPCLSSWLPAHKTVFPIIRVLVIACKCPGAVETDKCYIKRVCGILFINFVPIRRQVFWQLLPWNRKDSKSHVLRFYYSKRSSANHGFGLRVLHCL